MHELGLTSLSLTNTDARERLFQLVAELADVLDPFHQAIRPRRVGQWRAAADLGFDGTGRVLEDWPSVDAARQLRDEIERRVRALLASPGVPCQLTSSLAQCSDRSSTASVSA